MQLSSVKTGSVGSLLIVIWAFQPVPSSADGGAFSRPGCTYVYGGVSVTYMTREGLPVFYRQFECGGRYEKEYVDIEGRSVPESGLLPSERHALINALEEAMGTDLTIGDELDSELERYALENGLIR